MKTDLGVVKSGKDNKVEVDVPTKDDDIDQEYERNLAELSKPRPKDKQKRDEETKQSDYYRSFRSRVVLFWLISNLALIVGIMYSNSGIEGISLQGAETRTNIYLQISMSLFASLLTLVLWSVAGLAAFRFIGAITYLIVRLFQGE
jgi:chitin synthase